MADDDEAEPSPYSDNYLAQFAATTIQRWFRGWRVRKEYLARRARIRAVEMAWARHHDVSYRTDMAARIIQTAWRSFRNRRIFNYYRDLIRFRERGDPRELLRVINPREAQLVDAAAGIHVRFRLGGTVFPPLVFYKIFTHRPVADIGAFGPRDYASEVRCTAGEVHNRPTAAAGAGAGAPAALSKLQPLSIGGAAAAAAASTAVAGGRAKNKHTFREGDFELDNSFREYIKPDGTIGWRNTVGWYERYENNGWRPVAERALLDEDPVTTMTRLKRQPLFHHNPAVRRENRARMVKQKKREWLRKLYTEGAGGLRPGSAGFGGPRGAGGAAGGGADLPDLDPDLDIDALDDGQLDQKVDDLLAWSQHLDFGSYFDDWTSMACTLASEAFVPEDEAPYLEEIPGPHGDVREALQAAGVPLVPFKGGPNAACGTAVPLR
ncbi:hypothetical protein GPECTOR_49g471 [Gonium pectorale]|uniref:Uncharacterized protein n=1 Tax=Gonium pectorale TaxID=33097 RepID=A0A150G7R5_GONPE|nr:hypothetical protein GPECTOR_49g471 [Gonium pectorale]|eukprot:KXZ45887.1 hypothetical protein GPECTOR_49g471 [Gonium pectorale]